MLTRCVPCIQQRHRACQRGMQTLGGDCSCWCVSSRVQNPFFSPPAVQYAPYTGPRPSAYDVKTNPEWVDEGLIEEDLRKPARRKGAKISPRRGAEGRAWLAAQAAKKARKAKRVKGNPLTRAEETELLDEADRRAAAGASGEAKGMRDAAWAFSSGNAAVKQRRAGSRWLKSNPKKKSPPRTRSRGSEAAFKRGAKKFVSELSLYVQSLGGHLDVLHMTELLSDGSVRDVYVLSASYPGKKSKPTAELNNLTGEIRDLTGVGASTSVFAIDPLGDLLKKMAKAARAKQRAGKKGSSPKRRPKSASVLKVLERADKLLREFGTPF